MSNTTPLIAQQDGAVLTLSINDPPMNRMTFEFMDVFERHVLKAAQDPSVRAIVVTAVGDQNFSVGMDLKQMMGIAGDLSKMEVILDQRLRVLAAIENMEKPVVATLFGYCLGGGLELPLACHFRLAAAEGAQIGLPEMDLGTVPAWGGTARLTRCVGRANALDMILQAKKIGGVEAARIGLVQELHPLADLKTAANELAHRLAAMAPIAAAGVLRCVVGAEGSSFDEAIREERAAFLRCAASADQAEGVRAFMEKRRPRFSGK